MSTIGSIDSIPVKNVEWKIKNFSSLSKEDGYCYNSPIFSFADEAWVLSIYPNGSSIRESIGHIDLCLWRKSSGSPINIEYSFALKTVMGKNEYVRYYVKNFGAWGEINKYISRMKLLNRKTELIPSDVLTVVCSLNNLDHIENANKKKSVTPALPQRNKILQDFKELLLGQEDCDAIIKVKGQELLAHRIILKARSPVFASIFTNDMKEKATGVVEIEDCEPSVFSNFLSYLYYEDLDNLSSENVFDLFMLSDKYDVPDLGAKCMEYIKQNMSIDTFCDTIHLALHYSKTDLINQCSDYFVKHALIILTTVKWQSFVSENPTHGNELFIKFAASVKDSKA